MNNEAYLINISIYQTISLKNSLSIFSSSSEANISLKSSGNDNTSAAKDVLPVSIPGFDVFGALLLSSLVGVEGRKKPSSSSSILVSKRFFGRVPLSHENEAIEASLIDMHSADTFDLVHVLHVVENWTFVGIGVTTAGAILELGGVVE